MRNSNLKVWKSQAKIMLKSLRFSTLNAETQSFVLHEMFYFNSSRMPIIAWTILAIQVFDLFNVLFLSKSGLATPNNRQYFTMYLLMIVSCVVFFGLHFRLKSQKKDVLHRCYIGITLFWAVWNAVLTAMDLRHNPDITVFITAMFSLSFLLRLKPCESISILSVSLLVLFLCAGDNMRVGLVVNSVIVVIFAAVVSCSRYFSTLEEMGYRQKMILQANHRTVEKQKLHFLYQQRSEFLKFSDELLFVWDREGATLSFANDQTLSEDDRRLLLGWLLNCQSESLRGTISLRLGEEQPCDYIIDGTLQMDDDKMPLGAVGKLTRCSL